MPGSHDTNQTSRIDRRSIAIIPDSADFTSAAYYYLANDAPQPSPTLTGGLSRSQTVLRRDGSGARNSSSISSSNNYLTHRNSVADYAHLVSSQNADFTPPSAWSPNLDLLPTPQERDPHEQQYSPPAVSSSETLANAASMSHADRKSSQDSNPHVALDRFTQRRLQRLNTEQGFREQRQGGQGVLSPPLSHNAPSLSTSSSGGSEHATPSYSASAGTQYAGNSNADAQPQSMHHTQPQQIGYQPSSRTTTQQQQPNVGLGLQTQPSANPSRAHHYPPQDSQPQYSPESASYDAARPPLNQSRSFSSHVIAEDTSSMSNNGALPAPKATRAGNGNRQSVHNGVASREGSHSTQGSQVPAFSASVVPPSSQGQPYKANAGQQPQQQQQQQAEAVREAGRGTPQPLQISGDEMTQEDVEVLVKEHKELRKIAPPHPLEHLS